jgi:hypothetical protein
MLFLRTQIQQNDSRDFWHHAAFPYHAQSAAPARHTHSPQVHQPVAMVRPSLPLPGAIRLIGKAVRVSCHLGGRRLGEQGTGNGPEALPKANTANLSALGGPHVVFLTPLTTSTAHHRLVNRLCNIAQPIDLDMVRRKVHHGQALSRKIATWLPQRRSVVAATSKSLTVQQSWLAMP